MLAWLMIAMCLAFGFLGLKKGLYVMWSVLFNLFFAVFVSVLSTLSLLSYSPEYERHGYYASLGVFLLFFLIFSLLQVFAWFYFLRHRDEYFPKMLDRVGGFLVGGASGYIISVLLILILCIMPCSVEGKVDWFCTRDKMQSLAVPGICKVCNFLAWYSIECFNGDAEKAVEELINITNPPEEGKMLHHVPTEAPSLSPQRQFQDD